MFELKFYLVLISFFLLSNNLLSFTQSRTSTKRSRNPKFKAIQQKAFPTATKK